MTHPSLGPVHRPVWVSENTCPIVLPPPVMSFCSVSLWLSSPSLPALVWVCLVSVWASKPGGRGRSCDFWLLIEVVVMQGADWLLGFLGSGFFFPFWDRGFWGILGSITSVYGINILISSAVLPVSWLRCANHLPFLIPNGFFIFNQRFRT